MNSTAHLICHAASLEEGAEGRMYLLHTSLACLVIVWARGSKMASVWWAAMSAVIAVRCLEFRSIRSRYVPAEIATEESVDSAEDAHVPQRV